MKSSLASVIVLHLVGLALAVLDLMLWFMSFGPVWMCLKLWRRPTFASQVLRVGEEDVNGKGMAPSPVYRNAKARGGLKASPYAGVETLYDLARRSYERFAQRPAQAERAFDKYVKLSEEDRFPAKVFGETVRTSYADVGEKAHAFGCGLRALGLEPCPASAASGALEDARGAFKVLLFEDTCADWMVACQGAFSQSMVVFTAYATLGMDAVVDAVAEGECAALVCNHRALASVCARLPDMPSLKAVIFTPLFCEGRPDEAPASLQSGAGAVRILSVDAVQRLGRERPVAAVPPAADGAAVVMYTSGSTGKPKGVVIRHRQVVGCVAGVTEQLSSHLEEGKERYLAYLPLAHILELAAEFALFGLGGCLCYAHPKDLSTGPGKCHPACGGALAAHRPTAMAGVPKIWEVLMKGAMAKVEAGPPAARFLFALAMRLKAMAVRQGRYTPLFDAVVFKKLKAAVGGELKFTLSGGGAISPKVHEWVRTAFGCPMVQGYGLTEVSGAISVQSLDSVQLRACGPVISSLEVLLHSEPELKDKAGLPYLATDTVGADGEPCLGRGEVWVRGTNVSDGYYRREATTREAFGGGFFRTGDIGVLLPSGDIRIVDRKKNLVKLKGGEYIAIEAMEGAYGTSPYVNALAGGVLCFGDDSLDRPLAIVQVDCQRLGAWARRSGVDFATDDELCAAPEAAAEVLMDMRKIGKAAGLGANEIVDAVGLVSNQGSDAVAEPNSPWTPDNGLLTASNKMQRRVILANVAALLEAVKEQVHAKRA